MVYDRRRGCLLADNEKISAYRGYGGTSVAPIKFMFIMDMFFWTKKKATALFTSAGVQFSIGVRNAVAFSGEVYRFMIVSSRQICVIIK